MLHDEEEGNKLRENFCSPMKWDIKKRSVGKVSRKGIVGF